jgi:hypothetical protein
MMANKSSSGDVGAIEPLVPASPDKFIVRYRLSLLVNCMLINTTN